MKKVKILHVGQMIGGLNIYIRNSIINNNSNNEYILVHGDGDKSEPVIKNGKKIQEYSVPIYRSLNPLKDLQALYKVYKIVRIEKPSLIHCHSAKGGIIGRIVGFLTGVKTYYTPHAFSFLSTPSLLKRFIYKSIERITRCNSYILACSESEKKMAVMEVGYSESHAFVWHNSVPDSFLEKGKIQDIAEQYVCYIGRPCYQKNPLFLVDVVRKVKEKGYNLKFLLLGVGYHSPELGAMEEKIKDYGLETMITLVPWISHADCQEYLRKSLFYLSTSLYEGLPLSIIEAMANSKAIIASNVVGNIDCVFDGVNGFLLNLNSDLFAEKIGELVDNENLRQKMGKKSREIFMSKFYINKQIKFLQKIYEQ